MADQKISELQLVVATGVSATGIYVPLYTPMLAPANRRISAAELFKTPKRIEVSDPALAGNGEVMTLTSSYGTASLRAGTGGQLVVGGDFAAVGGISVVSDSSALRLGTSSDVGFLRTGSGLVQVTNIGAGLGSLHAATLRASGAPPITADNPALMIRQRWDNASVDFNGIIFDVVPHNAGASSNFIDCRVSGVSYSKLSRFGDWQSLAYTTSDFTARMQTALFKVRSTGQFGWTNSTSAALNPDTGLAREASGVVKATDGSSGTGSFSARNYNAVVYSITDGVSVDINPASGAIQTWTLTSGRTPTANNFTAGQSVLLHIGRSGSFDVTWSTINVTWLDNEVPVIPASGSAVVSLYKIGSTVYGSYVGDVA